MSVSVDDIQSRVSGMVDQDQDVNNIDSSDYALRLNYLNRREQSWAELSRWQVLYKEYNTLTSTASSNTVSLPDDYRYLASYPKITYDGVTTDSFTEIKPATKGQYNSNSDRYIEIRGNKNSGYKMIVNPAVTSGYLASGASIKIPYYSVPTSLASPDNIVACPNPEYLVAGVIADVWKSREDARFQAQQVEANLLLQNMLEAEHVPSRASDDDRVKTIERTKHNYRWGE